MNPLLWICVKIKIKTISLSPHSEILNMSKVAVLGQWEVYEVLTWSWRHRHTCRHINTQLASEKALFVYIANTNCLWTSSAHTTPTASSKLLIIAHYIRVTGAPTSYLTNHLCPEHLWNNKTRPRRSQGCHCKLEECEWQSGRQQ